MGYWSWTMFQVTGSQQISVPLSLIGSTGIRAQNGKDWISLRMMCTIAIAFIIGISDISYCNFPVAYSLQIYYNHRVRDHISTAH